MAVLSRLFFAGLMLAFILVANAATSPRDAAKPEPLVLRPLRVIRRGSEKRDIKVDRRAALELRSEESFHWGDENSMLLAQFKVAMPGRTENIVNLEPMMDDGAIQSIECPAGGGGLLKVKFADAADLQHALGVWEWVNEDPQHHFAMVLGPQDCGLQSLSDEEDRIIYDVSGLSYEGDGQTTVLDVRRTTWKDVAHTFDLTIGKPPSTTDGELRRFRRSSLFDKFLEDPVGVVATGIQQATSALAPAFTKVTAGAGAIATEIAKVLPALDTAQELTVPLDAQLSGKSQSFGQEGSGVTVTCKNCSIAGAFGFQARFRAEKGQMKEASLDMTTPRAFSAQALVRLQVNKTTKIPVLSTPIPIFKSAPQGISILNILEVGPKYEIGLGIEIFAIAGDLDVTAGGRVTIPASSKLRLNLLSQDPAGAVEAKGWTANFQKDKPEAFGFKGAKVVMSLRPSVAMVTKIFDVAELTAEIFAKTPFVASTFKDIRSSNCSACGEHENGFQGDFTFGAAFGAKLKSTVGPGIPLPLPLHNITFAEKEVPIGGFCAGSDPAGSKCPALIKEATKAKAPPAPAPPAVEQDCGSGC